MGITRGIIAGSGEFPSYLLRELHKQGYRCVVAGIEGESPDSLCDQADEFSVFGPARINDLAGFFRAHGVSKAFFAGKIDHRRVFRLKDFDARLILKLTKLKDKSPTRLIRFFIDYLGTQGIKILDPSEFLAALFCREGILGRVKPSPQVLRDIEFGWDKARLLADSDIGQTIAVKEGVVVSVEGVEGTDATVERGGRLAGPGIVVIKVSRTHQDMRMDLPAVGLSNIEAMVRAGAAALCCEAEKMPLFQRNESIERADSSGIVIVAKKGPDPPA